MIYLSSPLRFPSSICVVVFMMFASLSVKAADLPDDQDYLDAAPADALWDGMYFGVHWGYGDGTAKWDDPSGYYRSNMDVSARSYNDGLLAGLQFGYRKQYDAIVVGVETDVSAGSLIGYAPCGAISGVGGSGDICGHKTDFMGSLTGTLGYATGRSLFYLKGGGAYSRDRASVSNYDNVLIPPVSKSSDRYGWTVGGGVAYAISPRWSVNVEYDHYDFGKQTYMTGTGVNAGSFSVDHAQEIAKFGLNYRLGDAAGSSTVLPISSNLVGEFGTRVGYSSGRFQYKLYDPFTPSQLNSVLTWHDQAGPAAEAFVHLYHTSGLFLKGTFGGVNIGSNKMYDEDTTETMAPDPYSKTVSSTKNGRDIYGTLDFGYTFLQANNWNLGGFVGYGYYKQRLNAYGCEQIATAPVCVPTGSVNPSALGLSHTEAWDTLRLGLTGSVNLSERLNLSGEAAWHAYSSLSAKDNHWFRPNINPLFEEGHSSKGYQLESTLTYLLTDDWKVGAGLRYLSLEADGSTQFPFPGVPRSGQIYESSRFTTFIQASYRF